MKIHLQLSKYRKSELLAVAMLAFVAVIVLNLFYIQIIRHDYYKKKAYEEQVAKFVLPAKRGQIFAKDGSTLVPLVLNEPVYTMYVDPQQMNDKSELINMVSKISKEKVVEEYKNLLDSDKLRYIVVARELNYKEAENIKKANIAGVGLTTADRRVYPEGDLAAQVLGYVNNEGKGQYGLEGALNRRLKGVDGTLQAVTDVRRIPLTVSDDDISIPAQDGENVVLSIDRNIQAYAEDALKRGLDRVRATKGSVIVMNPNNGHVLAMANYPSYSPAQYNKVEDYSVFQNAIVSEPYEAGSVIKTLTMGAGLDSGVVNVNTTFNNRGYVQVDDTKISNVEEDPVSANATMTDVLHYSLNTGVVYITQQMGGGKINLQARNKLYGYFHDNYRFGLLTGIEQAGEAKGTIIAPTEEQGNNVRYANMAFGQGMDVTMVQTAGAFAAAINGGTYYQPTVVAGSTKDGSSTKVSKPKVLKKNVIKSTTSSDLRNMIVQGRQLGALGGKDKPGFVVGGKTGTSQIIDAKTGKYTDDNSIGSYLGFGGNQTPQYVIMVQVKDSKAAGYAGTTAAGPIFGDVSNWLLDYLQIVPN